jgi:predicted RND superfamily exporter protein
VSSAESECKHSQTTGSALLFTSVVLSIGFFSYTISEMNNLFSFGLITGLTILFAFLADLVIAPALIGMLYSKKQKKSNTEILITQ